MTGTYVRSPRALSRRLPDGVLLLSPGEDDVIELSGTGVALWELLSEPVSLEEVVTALAAGFRADPSEVQTDVDPILRDLVTRGLVDELDRE